MSRKRPGLDRSARGRAQRRAVRPVPEFLEERLLLYSKLGDQFVYSSRITYSLMPDGTNVGGVSSVLFSTLNAKFATATWEAQIEQAASIWEAAANLNLALVSDGGEPVGTAGDQQDDPRFGDIRIGMVPLGSGVLAETFLPPPANGGTDAGDILLNSQINWQINSNYDLMSVMAHEFGHALGLGDVSSPTNPYPVMYGDYIGINQALTADDIAGIQAVDGVRKFDAYNDNGSRNLTYSTAANITSQFASNAQLAIPSLDITTAGDSEWFYFTVPSTTTGTMTVTRAVKQPELAFAQADGLQLITEPGGPGLGRQFDGRDRQRQHQRDVGPGVLHQGARGSRLRRHWRLRLARQRRLPVAVADPAPEHSGAAATRPGQRHDDQRSAREQYRVELTLGLHLLDRGNAE